MSLHLFQDRENIAKTSTMPHESSPRVPSLNADEGSMQQRIQELMELCTSLQRQQSQMAAKIKDQDLEISGLKARVKGIKDTREEFRANKSTELGSNDTEEMVNVLSSMEAANILSTGGAAASVSPVDVLLTAGVPTKKKLQEQIDAHIAREMEEEFARENQRLSEQVARDSEIARIHAEEELKMMIEGLDRSSEVIVKHLSKYKQAEADLFVGEKIELISELVKYQDYHAKILKNLVPLEEVYIKALQVKHPIIDWEIHSEGKREYWKIFRVGGHTKSYQFFVDMLKKFDRDDLHQLWTLAKETFSIKQPTSDKEKEL
nr:hypothetical protein [Tanacetum cinerariifolium]